MVFLGWRPNHLCYVTAIDYNALQIRIQLRFLWPHKNKNIISISISRSTITHDIPLMFERWVWMAAELNTLSELSSSLVCCCFDFCFSGLAGLVESDAVRLISDTISFLLSNVLNVVRCCMVTFSLIISDKDLDPRPGLVTSDSGLSRDASRDPGELVRRSVVGAGWR